MRGRIAGVVILAGIALVVWRSSEEERPGAPATTPVSCVAAEGASRWAPGDVGFRATATYGLRSEEWLASVGGLATRPGRVFVFDRGDPRVLVLSADLEPIAEWGGMGDGPGEFQAPTIRWGPRRYRDSNHLHATATSVFVYDGEAIEVFTAEGEFQYRVGGLVGMLDFGVRALSSDADGGMLYAMDSFDVRGREPRGLQTWATRDGRRVLLWERPLLDPPRVGRAAVNMPKLQAQPLWAGNDRCLVFNDGASDWLIRFDLSSGAVDSLPLPGWPAPSVTTESVEQNRAVLEAIQAATGRSLATTSGAPTAVRKWAAIALDPDGYVWMEAWREDATKPARVAILDSAGRFVETHLDAFPSGFGEAGVIYSVATDQDTDQDFIVRYER